MFRRPVGHRSPRTASVLPAAASLSERTPRPDARPLPERATSILVPSADRAWTEPGSSSEGRYRRCAALKVHTRNALPWASSARAASPAADLVVVEGTPGVRLRVLSDPVPAQRDLGQHAL